MCLMASFWALVFPTTCLGWDMGLNWVSFWGFFYLLFQRGKLPKINVARVMVLNLCTPTDDVLYLLLVSWKYSLRYWSYKARKIVVTNISTGHYLAKFLNGITVLVLCTLSVVIYICTIFHKNSFHSFKVIEQTLFSCENFQRSITPQEKKI